MEERNVGVGAGLVGLIGVRGGGWAVVGALVCFGVRNMEGSGGSTLRDGAVTLIDGAGDTCTTGSGGAGSGGGSKISAS